jgi:UbiD family decarboxylase
MPDLRSFLESLEEEGDLVRIDRAVSPKYEATALMKEYDGKQALLFQSPWYPRREDPSALDGEHKKSKGALDDQEI